MEKLDTLFLEDKNQSAFICYENFENYHRECNTSINDYLIQFDRHVAKLREFQITLPEPVLAYHALKSANLSPENERLIRATINNLTLYDMAQQLKKITRGNLTLINTSQQQSISVKKEMDIAFSRDDTHSKDDQILYAGKRTINLPCPSTCLVVALTTEEDLVNLTADIQIDKAQIATSGDANFTIPTNALTQKLIILLHKKIWYY